MNMPKINPNNIANDYLKILEEEREKNNQPSLYSVYYPEDLQGYIESLFADKAYACRNYSRILKLYEAVKAIVLETIEE